MLALSFNPSHSSAGGSSKKQKKIVFSNFTVEQVWSQLQHFTESLNKRVLTKLQDVATSEDFVEELSRKVEEAGKPQVDDEEPGDVAP